MRIANIKPTMKLAEGNREIDFVHSVVGGCLKQIKRSNDERCTNDPETVDAWTCYLNPRDIKGFITFIEMHIKGQDPIDFRNIKRFRKDLEKGEVQVEALICSKLFRSEKAEVEQLLSSWGTYENIKPYQLNLRKVPVLSPKTKDVAMQWSAIYWPLSWKGNPEHQDLLNAIFNFDAEKRIVNELQNLLKKSESSKNATIVARDNEHSQSPIMVTSSEDLRFQHPLKHSIIVAIDKIAEQERQRQVADKSQRGYLCQDLIVYTFFEPCPMCAMALVHSRIKRLVYLYPKPGGAIESSLYIGDRRDLNWKFDIWRWIDTESLTKLN